MHLGIMLVILKFIFMSLTILKPSDQSLWGKIFSLTKVSSQLGPNSWTSGFVDGLTGTLHSP